MISRYPRVTAALAALALIACLSLRAETGNAVPGQAAAQQAGQPPQTPPAPRRQGILVAPGGADGRGVYEAPAADDPANAAADLSPKPPVVPLSPADPRR